MLNTWVLMEAEENEIDAVILTHAHVDHAAYIHYLRPTFLFTAQKELC